MNRFFIVLAFLSSCGVAISSAQPQTSGRWEQSFKAGVVDPSTGTPTRGTEIIHLVGHKGRLYAGNGYWMDTRGYDNISWSQVLVLDSPGASWKVDLALGPRHLRVGFASFALYSNKSGGSCLTHVGLARPDGRNQSRG